MTPPLPVQSEDAAADPLTAYAASVHGLHQKLGRVRANHEEIAESLRRTAAALRAMSARRNRK